MANLTLLLSTLIAANHVLDHQGVLDAYGHISVRNPNTNTTFFLANGLAPALISSPNDLLEYNIEDASAINSTSRGYSERFIHSEIYKRFPGVDSVIHSHSEAVIPFGISGVALQPAYHDAGFLGTAGAEVPVYNIADFYNETDTQDLLVRNARLGAALASYLSASNTTHPNGTDTVPAPAHAVVQQQNHGLVIVGPNIISAVTRAVYTQENARIQTNAILLAGLANSAGQPQQSASAAESIEYLTPQERRDTNFNESSVGYFRPWTLWVRRTEADGFYRNDLGSPLSV